MKPRVVTIIQARTGSSRLPNKVLLPLGGRTVLERMLERVRAARHAGTIVVATTSDAADDVLAALCRQIGAHCFRGHATDLLDRHYRAALAWQAEAVVKIPSDCPLIDPAVIDRVIGEYLEHAGTCDYVSNLHPASFPDGNDVEVMSRTALATAWREAHRDFEREHTTPFLWDQPQRFRLRNVSIDLPGNYAMSHRYTLDYAEDYALIRAVFDALHPRHPLFGVADILHLLEERPDLRRLNQRYLGVNWYRHHLDALHTIRPADTRLPDDPGKKYEPVTR
ncbi:MAG: glycosyltransferase family protein [candidate division KSB1 bacterium]|nr:glycosyltransferase family protein [candidate division KSB1 bacterium]MDZ7276177.1 glycosyltransferase family protein [candidate division KSB1 bacterium]MDZ7287043.1 glycosyltransferase family protein [candidate division KSB1 bacterium]MDZ7297032.1 glycosyltransferase family protein [candidate division KSB1 bacterium]MDZ7309367.1 glycosyltransferase family protein [candidate division KSB1 bacterium]